MKPYKSTIELSESEIDVILEYLTGVHVSLYGEDHPESLLVRRLQLEKTYFEIAKSEECILEWAKEELKKRKKELQEQEV